jgi:hypothetical protein
VIGRGQVRAQGDAGHGRALTDPGLCPRAACPIRLPVVGFFFPPFFPSVMFTTGRACRFLASVRSVAAAWPVSPKKRQQARRMPQAGRSRCRRATRSFLSGHYSLRNPKQGAHFTHSEIKSFT